jgi:flagellar biosynthetic protein FlhB
VADPSKTESATPKKKEEARKRGQVPRSTELTSAIGLLGMLGVINMAGGFMLRELGKVATQAWGGLDTFQLDGADLGRHFRAFGLELLLLMGPLLLAAFLLAILSNVVQFGFLFAPEALTLHWENLLPSKGFQRIYSRRTAVETLKAFFKIGLIGCTAWFTVEGRMGGLLDLMNTNLALYLGVIGSLASTLMLRVGLVMLAIALLDYFYQRWEYEEGLKMSKQEVKDEYRQMEGDPAVKARIRKLQQETARRRMFAELPKADVVITNPTHLAVAIRYDGTSMDAPVLVAKGARLMAARIKAIAAEEGIPVMENKPLARALYQAVPVGGQVPGVFFAAIAEVLAFVYQAKGTLEAKARQNQQRIARKKQGLPNPGGQWGGAAGAP